MNKHILVRAFFWLIPRFFILFVFLYFVPWVDWTPLPDLSIPLSYFYHFIVTYVFARLAYGRHVPSWIDAGVVSGVFVLFGTLIEIFYVMLKFNATFREVAFNFTWHSLAITIVYVIAALVAKWRVQFKLQRELRAVLPAEKRS